MDGLISTPDLSTFLCTASQTVPSSRSGLINLYHCCSLLLLPQEDCRNCRTAWYPPASIAFHSSITGLEVDRRDTVLVWRKSVFIGFFQRMIKINVSYDDTRIYGKITHVDIGVEIEFSQLFIVTFCKFVCNGVAQNKFFFFWGGGNIDLRTWIVVPFGAKWTIIHVGKSTFPSKPDFEPPKWAPKCYWVILPV